MVSRRMAGEFCALGVTALDNASQIINRIFLLETVRYPRFRRALRLTIADEQRNTVELFLTAAETNPFLEK